MFVKSLEIKKKAFLAKQSSSQNENLQSFKRERKVSFLISGEHLRFGDKPIDPKLYPDRDRKPSAIALSWAPLHSKSS